jgi:hypothetical protein
MRRRNRGGTGGRSRVDSIVMAPFVQFSDERSSSRIDTDELAYDRAKHRVLRPLLRCAKPRNNSNANESAAVQ